ncbi:MAG: hypothetical protein KDI42_01945 [Gammaproteobacteria bacterium]|nr:hypothetical protein [Gammaproteobacteria bacterium]
MDKRISTHFKALGLNLAGSVSLGVGLPLQAAFIGNIQGGADLPAVPG